jgi:hypothetical protein
LIEITQIFNLQNFDKGISYKTIIPFLIDNYSMNDAHYFDFLTYAANKFECNGITKL